MTTISPVFFCIIIENFQKEKIIGSIREKNSHVFIFFLVKMLFVWFNWQKFGQYHNHHHHQQTFKIRNCWFFDILPFMKCFFLLLLLLLRNIIWNTLRISIYILWCDIHSSFHLFKLFNSIVLFVYLISIEMVENKKQKISKTLRIYPWFFSPHFFVEFMIHNFYFLHWH